jgi:hypothetical protein
MVEKQWFGSHDCSWTTQFSILAFKSEFALLFFPQTSAPKPD